MANESDNFTDYFQPPTHVTSDYIEVAYLSLIICIGVPLNLYAFVKLYIKYRTTKSRILLLSLHLNVSDLLILFFYAFVKVSWLLTYKWVGGETLCKIIKTIETLSVVSSSNIVVCIGLDRLFSLINPLQVRHNARFRCKLFLIVAWLFSLTCSAPQLYIWTIIQLAPDWAQCTDIWSVFDFAGKSTNETDTARTIYQILHLVFVFWLPLVIIFVCYIIIVRLVYINLSRDYSGCASSNVSRTNSLESPRSVRSQKSSFSFSIRNTNSDPSPLLRRNISRRRVRRMKYRSLKITVLIVLTYVVCWLPYNILSLWSILHYSSYVIVEDYVYFCYGLVAVNAVINPFIYSRA